MLKKALASILAITMFVSMGTSVFAEEEKEVLSYSTFCSFDDQTGEQIELKVPHYEDTPNYTLPSGVTSFQGVEEADVPAIQPFNYTSDWTAVSNVNNNPYNGIAQLTITYANGSIGYGTGFVVGDGKVLTAAHNLYHKDKGGFVSKVVLTFLKNGSSGTPQTIPSTNRFVNDGWRYGENDSSNAANDYGIIKVGTTGKMKFGLYSGVFAGTSYTISGYPWVSGKYNATKMYTDTAKLTSTSSGMVSGTVKHDLNIASGVSGAPMYGSNNYAVALQTYGWSNQVPSTATGEGENGSGGYATLITQSVIDFVKYI